MTFIPEDKILVLDGAMGTMIQRYGLSEDDYHTGPFAACNKELYGNNECLNLTRPDIIKAIHKEYIAAGADIIETNTFSANTISQSEYGCEEFASQMAYEGARLAREAADEAAALAASVGLSRKVWVAGSIGPTSKSLSLCPDASDPGFRPYSFEQMREAYRAQAEALIRGGVDLLLVETCFDALNVKAALAGIAAACSGVFSNTIPHCTSPTQNSHNPSATLMGGPDVVVSVSVGDKSGRTLTGQTLEAFYTAVRHYPIAAFGLNCSLGASEMMPLVEEIASWCECGVSCYPNAGLPNEMGAYDQTPAEMAAQVRELASRGLVNIVGGCCGTTPDHIRAIAQAVSGLAPRDLKTDIHKDIPSAKMGVFTDDNPKKQDSSAKMGVFTDEPLIVCGLETVKVDLANSNFTNVGERTNVAGSRKFARLISEGKYDEALQIAAKQIEDGARIIDINMDDAMLDSTREMERFVRYISNDPAVAKAALMIDSSHWETILAGLQNAQGKCIVNSISLKEGAEAFVEKARVIKSYGAAIVVMAFDEQGQATTYDRKIEICQRAYKLLTEEAGISPSDIIFDVNILSIGTGIEEHALYAIDFIEAVRWIKKNLPGALTSGGVSNLSFAFRGNNTVREAMHSAFLYHAIKAGLDMAIVNPSMLQVYDEIDPELLKCVEDVIFNTDPQATERLIDKATTITAKATAIQAGASPINQSSPVILSEAKDLLPVSQRLQNALINGRTETLEADLQEALTEYGSAVAIIEGPLMEGMEAVGKLFGDGKMFLPQVVKSAKVMRDAVEALSPYMESVGCCQQLNSTAGVRQRVVLATVKGDVHDIGKNITGIVLTCNGFEVHDLGVMVDKETILDAAEKLNADIVAVSGLITPSLYQMEELCREMTARGMTTPLLIGGATTSALHTAVKLAPLYDHVFYGADASAAAVLAKKCMIDREAFESEQHLEQQKLRDLYNKSGSADTAEETDDNTDKIPESQLFETDTYVTEIPANIPVKELPLEEILPYFDWKMFYAIWGVKYGSASPEAMELMQLRRDAEDELAVADFKIMLSAKFFHASANKTNEICFKADGKSHKWPMMRQEGDKNMSLCDFVAPESSGRKSAFGMFAICVHKRSKAHEHGCCCPACSNAYEDMIGKAVRMTLAEAASLWLNKAINSGSKIIKPAIGYSNCPDHTLKGEVLEILDGSVMHKEGHCTCGCSHDHAHSHSHAGPLGIQLTESYAMTPEASICGLIFMHPEAVYPQIRRISQQQYDNYVERRGMDSDTARRFLGHLLK